MKLERSPERNELSLGHRPFAAQEEMGLNPGVRRCGRGGRAGNLTSRANGYPGPPERTPRIQPES